MAYKAPKGAPKITKSGTKRTGPSRLTTPRPKGGAAGGRGR